MEDKNYNDEEKMSQTSQGAETYLQMSASIQQHYFDLLISSITIEKGWKVLDLGCGTGNGTVKLSEKVGPNGNVVGIDPIQERIKQAKEKFASPSIDYYVGYGRDAKEFCNGYDLVVAGTVMHWLSPAEKTATFQSVFESLKPGGIFLFNCIVEKNSVNILKFLDFLDDSSIKDKIFSSFFLPTKEEFEEMSATTGFSQTNIKKVSVSLPYDSLDAALKHASASWHVVDFNTMLGKLREIVKNRNNDISFIFNDEKQPHFKNEYLFVTCKK